MPRNQTGRWVARAGATGGSRTYRGQMPVNWYAALVLIVLLGLGSIVFARYEYERPASSSSTPPAVGTTWYAGYDFDICGSQIPSLASNQSSTSSTQAFYTTGNGVITISPKKAGQAGTNATLDKFVSAYPKLSVTDNELKIPSSKGVVTYRNGQTCPKGTKYAGKTARIVVTEWSNFLQKTKPVTLKSDFAKLRFSSNQLITIGFVPKGTTLPRPPGTVVTALLDATTASSTTTTTAPSSTTTTASSSTTTTAPATTTTTAPATTTTAPTSSTAPASKSSKKS